MTTIRAVVVPILAVLARLIAADSVLEGAAQHDGSWIQSNAIITSLIVTTATILSLEIFDVTPLSRPLAAVTVALVWLGVLSEELQFSSLLAAIFYSIHETHVERLRGFPCIFQSEMARRMSMWSLFWIRVVVSGATTATTTTLFKLQSLDSVHPTLSPIPVMAVARSALFHAVYCECAEVLVRLYFATTAFHYDWRRRRLLLVMSFCIGVVHTTGLLALVIKYLQQRVSCAQLAMVLVVWMWISIRTPWPLVADQVTSIASAINEKMNAPSTVQSTTTRRRCSSILTRRTTSDVEVVEMTTELHADHRHFSS